MNDQVLPLGECNMLCAGTTSGEYCGGNSKISAYLIEEPEKVTAGYVGCYADEPVRAMDAEEKHVTGDMTNEACIWYCAQEGHAYAGTQYSTECWCGDSYDLYGQISDDLCDYPCEGEADQACGGSYALSVYSTG